MKKKKKKNKIHKKTLMFGMSVFVILCLILVLGLFFIINKNLNKSNVEVSTIPVKTEDEISYTEVKGITNILLLSSDAREGETVSRSDSIIILTIDDTNKKIKLTSLMRDMLVSIKGHGDEKLNHAFAYGGPELMIETIQNNFGIKLDKYAVVDFNGFKSIVDLIGGVDAEIEDYEIDELNKYIVEGGGTTNDYILEEGPQLLNGYQALSYARIRKVGNGEYERTERQRKLLTSLTKKAKQINPLKIPKLINEGIKYVDTNLTLKDIINLSYTALNLDTSNITTLQVPLQNACVSTIYSEKGWVFVIDKKENSNALKEFIFNDNPNYVVTYNRMDSILEEYNNKYGIVDLEDEDIEENPLIEIETDLDIDIKEDATEIEEDDTILDDENKPNNEKLPSIEEEESKEEENEEIIIPEAPSKEETKPSTKPNTNTTTKPDTNNTNTTTKPNIN